MLGGESRQARRLPHLRTARYRNHDGGFLLTLRRRFNRVASTAGDGGEDVEKVDCENRVEEHLAVGLRNTMPVQPAINNDEILNLHRETRRLAPALVPVVPLLLPHGHVSQCFELTGADLYRREGTLHHCLGFGVTAL